MYSFGVSGWYGVGMSNWSVYKRVGICYWGMSIRKSSIGYYWCLYFDWFWSFNLDSLYGWSGNGNSSLTNGIDESILVDIFRETFEVRGRAPRGVATRSPHAGVRGPAGAPDWRSCGSAAGAADPIAATAKMINAFIVILKCCEEIRNKINLLMN